MTIRDVAQRWLECNTATPAPDIDRLAEWVLAATEPGGYVVSAEECERFLWSLHERANPSKEDEEIEDLARSVIALHARLAERDKTIERLNDRLRETCQILVDAVGADGPCDAEDAARKAVAEIAVLKAEVARRNAERKKALADFKAEVALLDADPASHDLSDADRDLLP